MTTSEEPTEKSVGRRIFVNNIDCFQGKNIGKFLSNCVVGATLDWPERDEKDRLGSMQGADGKRREGCYEIVGTSKDKDIPKPDFAKEIVQYENQTQLYEYLVECDVIVYDVTEDMDQIQQAVWIITEMQSELEKIEKPKVFILISTCMTWARTASLETESADDHFTEDDYRKRKPHPNFKEHINAEKTILKLGKVNKAKLSTFVICSGLTYGAEENIFHHLFKAAWHNEPYLECFGDGQNIVPTIHIRDLAAIVQNIADGWSKFHYVIAKDNSQNTLEDIVKAISDNLGSKKVKYISKEEAFVNSLIEQSTFDMLMINLKMESTALKDDMRINWVSENGIAENIQLLIDEYKKSRNLQFTHLLYVTKCVSSLPDGVKPIRAVILGPPASGKSTIAKQLCEFYKLHHVVIKDVIDSEIQKLKTRSRKQDVFGETTDTELIAADAIEAQQLLNEIEQSKLNNNGRIEDKYIIKFLSNHLMSTPCQNQGFILDGYPKTIAQAQELYRSVSSEERPEDMLDTYNKSILPECVINLEATDKFLMRRVMNLPETSVIGTHNNEADLKRRLKEYWALNTYDESVLNFFDELELHSEKIDVTKDKSQMMKDTVEKIKKILGNPRNYGSTAEELEMLKRIEEEGRMKKERKEKKLIEKNEAEEMQERKRRLDEWSHRLQEIKKQEFELLEVQSVPLRNYLMTYVMPTLTQALIDCCKVRPEDPIDFLAEYLFQHNPQID